jgi:hypothetical protein
VVPAQAIRPRRESGWTFTPARRPASRRKLKWPGGWTCKGCALSVSLWRRSAQERQRSRAKPVCVKGLIFRCWGADRSAGGMTGARGRSLLVRSGNDCSEVPAFRDLPAAPDSRVAPECLPGPRLFQSRWSARSRR